MTPGPRERDTDWDIRERVTRLESEMREVKAWMPESKLFHTEARDFFSRSDERAKQRVKQEIEEKEKRDQVDKKRSRIHFWWLGILSGIIVAGFAILLGWAVNFESKHKISQDHHDQSTVSLPQDSQTHDQTVYVPSTVNSK